MASILIRCTGGVDMPADALAGWLERHSSRIDNRLRVTALRLAAVEHVDEPSGRLAGWLVELEVADGQVANSELARAETPADTRPLRLRPAVLVRYASARAELPEVEAGSYATAVDFSSA